MGLRAGKAGPVAPDPLRREFARPGFGRGAFLLEGRKPMRVATLLLGLAMVACGGSVHAQWAIIPQPQKVEAGRGSFVLGPDTRIVAPTSGVISAR